MVENQKIYILDGFNSDLLNRIKKSLSFIGKLNSLYTDIIIVEKLNITLDYNDFIIIYIDELSLSQIVSDANYKSFFTNNKISNYQIILILEDITYQQLPEYMQYYSQFKLILETNNSNEDENDNVDNKLKESSSLIQITSDIIKYIINCDLKDKNLKQTIFIGPPDGNTTYESHKVIRELLHRKYNIVPQIINESAKEVLENKEMLLEALTQASLAIHFISHHSLGEYPKIVSPSIAVNEIVAEYCNLKAINHLQRIVYIPGESEETSDEIIRKISQFKSDPKSLINAELVQTPIEKLKSIVLTKLDVLSKNKLKVNKLKEGLLYFVNAPGISDNFIQLKQLFSENSIEYHDSQVALDKLELLKYHREMLTKCEGIIIHNNGNNEWLQRKVSDIQKSPGWGRDSSFKYKIIFGKKPSDEFKTKYLDDSYLLIDELDQKHFDGIINKKTNG